MRKTKIDWADSTWNPVTGCLHGCKYCYARSIAARFGGAKSIVVDASGKLTESNLMPVDENLHELKIPICRMGKDNKEVIAPYPFYFEPTMHLYKLDEPKKWINPRTIFVCSMADLFGNWVPDAWIRKVFEACEAAPQHRYLFLTKNPKRFGQINGWNHQYNNAYAKDNMWFGTTITRQYEVKRIDNLPYGNAHTFISIEPILEPIDISSKIPTQSTQWKCSYCARYSSTYSLHCHSCGREGGYSGSFRKDPINWVIIGAESGNRKDKVIPKKEWIEDIVHVCEDHRIPVFMKESIRALMGSQFRQEYPWEK